MRSQPRGVFMGGAPAPTFRLSQYDRLGEILYSPTRYVLPSKSRESTKSIRISGKIRWIMTYFPPIFSGKTTAFLSTTLGFEIMTDFAQFHFLARKSLV